MALPLEAGTLEAVSLWALAAGLSYSVFVLARTGRLRPVTDRLRSRLVLGVPWGTVVVVASLLGVFYLLQGGGRAGGPVVVGYRSWSFSYLPGMVLGPFSHGGKGHLIGNLTSTVAFAPLAEYAWSHYPTERGSHSFGSRRTNPFVRILGFVCGVFLVGLATSFLIPGALIGFSGVVFAFAGLALVTVPIPAALALVGEEVVEVLFRALENPVLFARGRQQFVTPFWADIAIQGHALGLLIGVLVGFLLVRRRKTWPDTRRVWLAVLLFAGWKTLYAVYWYLSGTEYVLFRAIGVALILVLAGVVATAVTDRDVLLVDRIDLTSRQAAVGLLLSVVLALAVVAVPYNAISVQPGPEVERGIQVRDYTVTYAEDVPNRYISAVSIPVVRDSLQVPSSGVIVTSERRDAWEVVVPKGRLAVRGRVLVVVGGVGWRETLLAQRAGWSVVDGGNTYKVFLRRSGQRARQVYTADPVNVSAVIANRSVQIRPADRGFTLAVSHNGTVVGTGRVPARGNETAVGGIRFNRTDKSLRASANGTRLRIAKYRSGIENPYKRKQDV